jgi:UDP-glucose 4-epimerase
LTKLLAEKECEYYGENYDMRTASLRYFNVYGERQRLDSSYSTVIPAFINAALKGKAINIYGDGSVERDFTYVGDIVDANIAFMLDPHWSCTSFDVGCGLSYSIKDLARIIKEITKTNVPIKYLAKRRGDVPTTCADVDSAWHATMWRAKVKLTEGLSKTIQWWRKQNEKKAR